jgi:2-polyprenyl-6-methoxyphenol hydroxylase-like FAD-dependent oxidoreductase
MVESTSARAVIVGAGIGGLAAALALRQAGLAVTVVEQAASVRELGFALLLAPNAMRALRLLGVAEQVAMQGAVIARGEIRRSDGRVLKRMALEPIRQALAEDTVCALRPVVHGALLAELGQDAIVLGARATSVEQHGELASVVLEDGERLSGEVVIGADGIRSAVFQELHGGNPALRQSGLSAIRGVARADGSFLDGMVSAQYFGAGIEAGIARASADTLYWFISSETHALVSPSMPDKQAALERLRGFDPAFIAAVERSDPSEVRRDELFDREPALRWGQGRVTLLGDAAHPMLPHAGQGAAQALEDAVVLGRCLRQQRDVRQALARYEQLRLPRTASIVTLARRNASLGRLRGRFSCALRDAIFRLVPESLVAQRLIAMSRTPLGD